MARNDASPVEASRRVLIAEVESQFAACFGHRSRWVAAAPGRVNLIGEHTDYNDGFVLPIAIDRWAVVAAAPATGAGSTLCAADLDEVFRFEGESPAAPVAEPRWANYVLGVMHEFGQRGSALPPMEMLVASSIPIGAGLSSSAAIEVAAATVCEQITGDVLEPIEKALLCQRAEHSFAGTPCGIMDMLISGCATAGHALLIDCRDLRFEPVPLPREDELAILVVDTGIRHILAAGEYAERRATCRSAAAKLGLPSLREATLEMLEQEDLTKLERERSSHVITENTRTLLAARALQEKDLHTLGEMMFASHDSLRDLYAVSCPELDSIVDVVKQQRSEGMKVYGARMTGGGFGGCAIVVCAPDAVAPIGEEIGVAFHARFNRFPALYGVHAVAGVCGEASRDGDG